MELSSRAGASVAVVRGRQWTRELAEYYRSPRPRTLRRLFFEVTHLLCWRGTAAAIRVLHSGGRTTEFTPARPPLGFHSSRPIPRAAPSRSSPLSSALFEDMIGHGRFRCDLAALNSKSSPGEYPPHLDDPLSPYHSARPCSIGFLWQSSSPTSEVQLPQPCPYSPLSRVLSVPPLPARVPCFLPRQALSRWGHSSRAASLLRGSPRGPGFSFIRLPGVSCVPLPAGVSPWRVDFSAFVISRAFACEFKDVWPSPVRLRGRASRWSRDRGSSAFGFTAWVRSDFGQYLFGAPALTLSGHRGPVPRAFGH